MFFRQWKSGVTSPFLMLPETVGHSGICLTRIGEATAVVELLDGSNGDVLSVVWSIVRCRGRRG